MAHFLRGKLISIDSHPNVLHRRLLHSYCSFLQKLQYVNHHKLCIQMIQTRQHIRWFSSFCSQCNIYCTCMSFFQLRISSMILADQYYLSWKIQLLVLIKVVVILLVCQQLVISLLRSFLLVLDNLIKLFINFIQCV